MRPTYHLVPAETWASLDRSAPYRAASLETEGFIHCTDGAAALFTTAERHLRADPRPFLALTVDLDAIAARWTIEDAAGIYPHVFGPIEQDAIRRVERMVRDESGAFTGLAPFQDPTPAGGDRTKPD